MEKVNLTEFRARITFFLENLPVAITQHGKVVAEVHPPGHSNIFETVSRPTSNDAPIQPEDSKEEKIEKLRALIQTKEQKTTHQEPAAEEEEVRVYTEYDEQRGENIQVEGTFAEFVKKFGKLRAVAIWKQSKPAK